MDAIKRVVEKLPFPIVFALAIVILSAWIIRQFHPDWPNYGNVFRDRYFIGIVILCFSSLSIFYSVRIIFFKFLPRKRNRNVWSTANLYVKGIQTELSAGDGILIIDERRERDVPSEQWKFHTVKAISPYPKRGYTVVTWGETFGKDSPWIKITPPETPKVYVFRRKVALLGHDIPDTRQDLRSSTGNEIHLEKEVPDIVRDCYAVLRQKGKYLQLYKVERVWTETCTDFGLPPARVTCIELDTGELLDHFDLRRTEVFVQSNQLDLV